MNINKEAIYDTRPWKVFGEGPIAEGNVQLKAQGFNEGAYSKADAKEIRFTQTEKNLYATVLEWPEDGKILIKSLAEGNELYPNKISKVELLGYGKVPFSRTDKGLIVNIPNKSLKNIAPVFKIRK
jgi:alpha-L-fucosidase